MRSFVEGQPVQLERALRFVAQRFHLSCLHRSRRRQLARLVPQQQELSDRLEEFIWPDRLDPVSWREFRPSPDGADRGLAAIDPREMINAMEHLVRATFSMEHEELMRETAAIFGIRRMGALVRERLEAVLEHAVSTGASPEGS